MAMGCQVAGQDQVVLCFSLKMHLPMVEMLSRPMFQPLVVQVAQRLTISKIQ